MKQQTKSAIACAFAASLALAGLLLHLDPVLQLEASPFTASVAADELELYDLPKCCVTCREDVAMC